jgi:pteridine reductase
VGWQVVQYLAAQGYALVVHYNTSGIEAEATVKQLQERQVVAMAVQADMRDEHSIGQMVERIMERHGRIDALVNCAATYQSKRLEEVTADDVRHFFEVNTLGTFLCSQLVGLAMVRQPEGGNIILVGDWACRRPYLNYAAYFPSKGTIPTITRTLAVELGTRNPAVRVNCILPGPVMLPPDMPPAERQQAINATLVKREGKPENIAQAVKFLLDNDFVTGISLPVDGGRSVYAPECDLPF